MHPDDRGSHFRGSPFFMLIFQKALLDDCEVWAIVSLDQDFDQFFQLLPHQGNSDRSWSVSRKAI